MSERNAARVELIMGMPIAIDVRDSLDPAVLDSAFDWFRSVDARFSTYKVDSEIGQINRGMLPMEDAHEDVQAVLAQCEELRKMTAGYFDIRTDALPPEGLPAGYVTPPGAVDPSGYVKGWSVERAAQLLERAGAHNFCINAGGDIVARGEPEPGLPWRVGIRHPLQHDLLAAVVAVRDRAVATSGTYERGLHIVDPHTGRPPMGTLSVTIVGPDLGMADAYATAAFAMGRSGPTWTAYIADYEAMTILEDERVLFTPEFPSLPSNGPNGSPDTTTHNLRE